MIPKEAERAIKILDDFFKILPPKSPFEELLNWDECCVVAGLSNLELLSWAIAGKVKIYGLGNNPYFNKKEVLSQLLSKK